MKSSLRLGLAVLLGVLTLAWLIDKAPPPLHFDEPIIGASAVAVARTGDLLAQGTLGLGVANVNRPLAYFALGGWLNAFGVGLAQARLWVVAMGTLALVLVALMLPRGMARWGALSVGFVILLGQAYVRYDALAMPFLALGLLLMGRYVGALPLRPTMGYRPLDIIRGGVEARHHAYIFFLIGFFLALVVEGHSLYLVVALAVGTWQTWAYVAHLRGGWAYAPFWGILAGGLAYGALYVGVRVLLFGMSLPETLDFLRHSYEVEVGIGGGVSAQERVLQGLAERWRYSVAVMPLEGAIIALATAIALMRRADARLRVGVGLYWLSLLFFVVLNPKPQNTHYYAMHALPLLAWLAGESLAVLEARSKRVVLAVSLLACVWGVANLGVMARQNDVRELLQVSEAFNAQLPADVRGVIAPQVFYWGLARRDVFHTADFGKREVVPFLSANGFTPPDAVVLLAGLTDEVPNVRAYAEGAGFARVACVRVQAFGGRAELYVHPRFGVQEIGQC